MKVAFGLLSVAIVLRQKKIVNQPYIKGKKKIMVGKPFVWKKTSM